LYINSNNCIFC